MKNMKELARREISYWNDFLDGMSYQEIAKKQGVTPGTVAKYIQGLIETRRLEDKKVVEWRITVSARLDEALKPLMQIIRDYGIDGSKVTISQLVSVIGGIDRIESRRAKMLGLDKPTKIDVTRWSPATDPKGAAARQQARLQESGFAELSTRVPREIVGTVVETNGNSTKTEES